MSTINEALKKAQKERETRHLLYRSILSTGGGRKAFFKKKHLSWFIIAVILIMGTLASDAWLNKKNTSPPVIKVMKEVRPEQARSSEPPSIGYGKNIDRLYDRARNFHGAGRLKLAKRFYLEILKINPGHANALNNLGVICLVEKDFEEAENYFAKALKLNSGSVDPYYNLACLYALQGNRGQGIDHLKKAVQLDKTAREWAKRDRDLDGLRDAPEFKALINRDYYADKTPRP